MDTRAQLLIDELSTHPEGKAVDFTYWRGRFQTLFEEKLEHTDRQVLLQAYAALLNLMERGLSAKGGDISSFRQARRADWNTLCIQEALQRSGTDLFHPDDLSEIVSREIAAGRMEAGEFSDFAAAGSAVLAGRNSFKSEKKGFFRRLFG